MVGFAIWKVKDGIELNKEKLSYFSPGGFAFKHKTGEFVSFDFEESTSSFTEDNRYICVNLRYLDEDFITSCLKDQKQDNLIQEYYDTNFFKDGYIDLNDDYCEMCCCIDIQLDMNDEKSIVYEADDKMYLEPVYISIYNDEDCIELYNKLSKEEYKQLIGEE